VSSAIELTHATVLFTDRGDGDLGRTTDRPSEQSVANREALRTRHGLRCIRAAHQVHGAAVVTVGGGEGYRVGPATADVVVTSARDTAVAVHVADCLPIAIAGDGGVAIVHAGWRGLAAGVIATGVAALADLGVRRGGLEAAIGPGAGGCCYETGPEVHVAFAAYGASSGRRLDLAAIAAAQLREAGVTAISDVGVCTLCAPAGLLFSHRRDGPDTGRQAGIAWLR
jgi:YfiH family protein